MIVLLGARLNWMLHFGQPPRFAENVKIIQIDINAEELGNNSNDCIKIQADLKSFSKQVKIIKIILVFFIYFKYF